MFSIWCLVSKLTPASPSSAGCRNGSRPYLSFVSGNGVAEELWKRLSDVCSSTILFPAEHILLAMPVGTHSSFCT